MINKNKPLVSVCMITYNHEKFINQAIEGVAIQKCSFPIELVIGEDLSQDKTREICNKYAKDYQFIRLIPSTCNLGVVANFIKTIQACTGKYIALCEGDDYWIDPNKLQKQVDFLEANEKYSLIHTNGFRNINGKMKCWQEWPLEGDVQEYLYTGTKVKTCSAMLRSSYLKEYLAILPLSKCRIIGDWPLFAFYSTKGKFGYLSDCTCVYRYNPSSVSNRGSFNSYFKYSLDIIEAKRFLRNVIFKNDLEEMYSEEILKTDELYVRFKHAYDIFDYNTANLLAQEHLLNKKSKRLAFFTKNRFLFFIGCQLKKNREKVSNLFCANNKA